MISLSNYGLTIEEIDKEFDEKIYSYVRKQRTEMAQKEVVSFVKDRNKKIQGMLLSVLERTPFEDTEGTLQFNIMLTEKLCKNILTERVGLTEKIAMYAAAVELGAKEFFDPYNNCNLKIHLGAAKNNGFFFTPPSVAIRMIMTALEYNENAEHIIDPACGAGIFLAYQLLLNDKITRAVGVEIDRTTAQYAQILLEYVKKELNSDANINIISSDFFDYYSDNAEERYDLIVMNPPYGSLKFLSSDLTDVSTAAEMSTADREALQERLRSSMLEYTARLRYQFKSYGIEKGTLEYSKLFLAATHKMLSKGGYVVAITPLSWLGDETSSLFRKNVVAEGYVHELWFFPEIAKLFQGVNQPTVVSVIGEKKANRIKISNSVKKVTDISDNVTYLDVDAICEVSGEKCKLPKCDEQSLEILKALLTEGKFGNINGIVNSRGELDLTAYKQYVSQTNTGHRLIRGDHIQGWELTSASMSDKPGYVYFEDFCKQIENSSKAKDIDKKRVAIAQCSYLQKKKRIEAAIIPEGSIISNSCNYICINGNDTELGYYWAWINSYICEWAFRIFSYNNHVGNKEIDELPCVPYTSLDSELMDKIEEVLCCNDDDKTILLNAMIAHTFKISAEIYKKILCDIGVDDIESYIREYQNNWEVLA